MYILSIKKKKVSVNFTVDSPVALEEQSSIFTFVIR